MYISIHPKKINKNKELNKMQIYYAEFILIFKIITNIYQITHLVEMKS